MKTVAIVGRGPVGQSIYDTLITNQQYKINQYHSQNIKEAYNTQPDILIYAGVPGYKWIANENPLNDMKLMDDAYLNIKKIKAKEIILISTIDALASKNQSNWSHYGQNRLDLEQRVMNDFKNISIIRLPGLIGRHVKKNIWFDIHHPYPSELGETMKYQLNQIVMRLQKDHYLDYKMQYMPSLESWKKHNLGLYQATHPYSRMLWLDIDHLNPLQFAQSGKIILIASTYNSKPALFYTYELFEKTTGYKLEHLSKEESNEYLNLIDYSECMNEDIIYINELNLKERI